MSELLRLANLLTEWAKLEDPVGWVYNRNAYVYAQDTYTVIKGYQELLREIVDVYEHTSFYDLTDDLEPVIKNVKASIPEVDND